VSVLFVDDEQGRAMKRQARGPVLALSRLPRGSDVVVTEKRLGSDGIRLRLGTPSGALEISSPLVGDFNVANILTAVGIALGHGIPADAIATGVARLRGVPGRLESVANEAGVLCVVDYAHTPDAVDKLLAAVDLYVEPQIQAAIALAEAIDNPRVFFWLHRGAAGFMSDEHFEKFYWPSIRKVVLALVEAGLTPILHVQGDYTPRLPHLAELPRGKVPIHYDRIDRQQALEIMGDRQCFWGGVSSALLVTGTEEQVKDDVKQLIDLFGPKGGLIVDGSVGIPDEAKSENVQAMVEAVREY